MGTDSLHTNHCQRNFNLLPRPFQMMTAVYSNKRRVQGFLTEVNKERDHHPVKKIDVNQEILIKDVSRWSEISALHVTGNINHTDF